MPWKQCTICGDLVVYRDTRDHLIKHHTSAFGDVSLDIVEGMFKDASTEVTGDDLRTWQAEARERTGRAITAMALTDHVRFFVDDMWADIPRAIMANKPERGMNDAVELFRQMIAGRPPAGR